MYQNLINSLKKILDSKATQAEKLLKISTLVDFADGLDKRPSYNPVAPVPATGVPVPGNPYDFGKDPIGGGPKITARPAGSGAIVGVEDVK